jgi:hypothetical protein
MTDPLTLIVLVAAGEGANPTTTAMVRATCDALSGAPVEMRETLAEPTDAEALAAEQQSHADAVIELIWNDVDRRHVTLRVHLATSRRWVERSIGFMPSDPAAERGRTLGFAAASILPEAAHNPPRPEVAVEPPVTSTVAPSELPAEMVATAPGVPPVPLASTVPSGESPTVAETPSVATSSRLPRIQIDLVAVGGIGGGATGAGGGGALSWVATDALSFRVGASERAGRLDVAQASVFTLLMGAGVALRPWRPTRSRPLGLSFRGDYLVVRESATHFDSDDPTPVTRSRWLSGFDAMADVSWVLSTEVEALVGVGIEDVLASTYVNDKNVEVATLPALRAVGEGGFRLRF